MKKLKISYNSPVVLTFVLICAIVLVVGMITRGNSTKLLFMTYHSPLNDFLTYPRFFTHVFGHGGWEHFINNAAYLLLLGPMLEEKHGSKVLIKIIAITAFATGIVNYIFFPSVALCGASGVVFAFIILASFTGFKNGEIPLTFILVVVLYIGQQVYQGLFLKDNVSNFTHILGGAVGSVLGWYMERHKMSRYRG